MPRRESPPVFSAEEAAALVRPGDSVDYGFGLGQPDLFDRALAERRHELSDVTIRAALSLRPRAVLEADPEGRSFTWLNWHFSGYDRRQHDAGRAHYIPMNFGEAPDDYRRFIDPVDVVCLKTAPMDDHGWFNFGAATTYHAALVERARKVVVETSPAMPRVHGIENGVHASRVHAVVEGDSSPLAELSNPPPGETDRAVARLIAAEVEDGACLQIGIGAMPNAVCALLREAGVRDLGVHTEMLVDGMIDLVEAGIVTGARKQIDPGTIVFTFAAGSKRQYDFIDANPGVSARAVDYTNLPHVIMRNDRVVSINNTAEIDLQGQASSESAGWRHLTGTGGQLQFVRGAYASRGGKSFMCLSSTRERDGVRTSRVVPELAAGSIVTTPRTDVMYVVTEHGIANLKGKSVPERARALIAIAHPDFREELERAAFERRLLPRRS